MTHRYTASWIARVLIAGLVGLAGWTVSPGGVAANGEIEAKPRPHTTATQPDLTLTLNPWGESRSRSVGPGGSVSVIAWATSKNSIGADTSLRVVLSMGFTNVNIVERGGMDCVQWGPQASLGGTVVRCNGYMNSDGLLAMRIDATAPPTAGQKYEVTGLVVPTDDKDLNENNNYDSVWFTTTHGGTETKPRPHTTKDGGIVTKPNPNVRK